MASEQVLPTCCQTKTNQPTSKSCVSPSRHPEWRPNRNCLHGVNPSTSPDLALSTMWAKLVQHSAKQQVLHQSVRLRCATQSGNQTVIVRVLSTQAAAQTRHSDHTSSEPSAQLGSKSCVSQQCHPEWRPNGNCQHAVKASACPDQTSSTKWIKRAAGRRLLYQPITVAPPRVATKQNRASVRP